MKKVADYLRYAEECRAMASQSNSPDYRTKLAEMARLGKYWPKCAE